MHIPTRGELEQRMTALVADMLDHVAEDNPEGFDLGVVLIAYEARYPGPGADYLKRSDAGYTPDDDVWTYVGYWCSDHRRWIQRAITDEAYNRAHEDVAKSEDDDDAEESGE